MKLQFETYTVADFEFFRDEDHFLIGVYEKIGVFEEPRTWYTTAYNMLNATNFRDELKIWQTSLITIFNPSIWPHKNRPSHRTLETT